MRRARMIGGRSVGVSTFVDIARETKLDEEMGVNIGTVTSEVERK